MNQSKGLKRAGILLGLLALAGAAVAASMVNGRVSPEASATPGEKTSCSCPH